MSSKLKCKRTDPQSSAFQDEKPRIKLDSPVLVKPEATPAKTQPELSTGDDTFLSVCKDWQAISEISGVSSKAAKTQIMTRCFKQAIDRRPQMLIPLYYLCIMKTGPEYCSHQLGIGKQTISKVGIKITAMSQKQFYTALKEKGDLGTLVLQRKSTQKGIDSFMLVKKQKQPLTVQKVFNTLQKVSNTSGKNSASQKEGLLLNILFAATPLEAKYIFRWLQGNLKVQFAQKSMQQALAKSLCLKFFKRSEALQVFPQYELMLKKVLSQYPNYTTVISKLLQLKQDFRKLPDICKLTPGIPCKPMLAKPTKGFAQVIQRFEGKQFTCEYKYDGLRGQIHYQKGAVFIYSRNLQNMTEAYPDICQEIARIAKEDGIQQLVLDCEIVAVNPKTKQLLPFQILSTRGKKNVELAEIEVRICMFLFDLLYLNKPLVDQPLRERQRILRQSFSKHRNELLQLAQAHPCTEVQKMDEFLSESVKQGAQGLMVKDLGSKYCPSKRSFDWVKLKKDYINGLGDTIDCVPVGAWHGSGKRSGVYGSYLLAVYNQDLQTFQTICRIGTGFSDEILEAAYKYFQDKLSKECPSNVRHCESDSVDQWFVPSCVWEVKGADLQRSPIYTCGLSSQRGIGLRFPRLLRVRDDKKPVNASTVEQVKQMYESQAVVQNQQANEEDDDFY